MSRHDMGMHNGRVLTDSLKKIEFFNNN